MNLPSSTKETLDFAAEISGGEQFFKSGLIYPVSLILVGLSCIYISCHLTYSKISRIRGILHFCISGMDCRGLLPGDKKYSCETTKDLLGGKIPTFILWHIDCYIF